MNIWDEFGVSGGSIGRKFGRHGCILGDKNEVCVGGGVRIKYLAQRGLRILTHHLSSDDRLCGLVVRVSGYRYRGLGFDSRHYQIF